jgi:hypothetical protein
MKERKEEFFQLITHPLKSRWFLLSKLPAAFFAGVRLRAIDRQSCNVTVPYKWLSQNPFRSTYFACLSMAAEMSTGALAMSCVYKSKPAVSMLVVKVESAYFKKANKRTQFICEDGEVFDHAVRTAIDTGLPQIVKAKSVGKDPHGEVIAEFFITWSFKSKQDPESINQ